MNWRAGLKAVAIYLVATIAVLIVGLVALILYGWAWHFLGATGIFALSLLAGCVVVFSIYANED